MPIRQEGNTTMAVMIGSARIDERGKAYGGKAGDQTGKEVSRQAWYLNKKGWYLIRAKDVDISNKIADCMDWACKNPRIGYDQWQRTTLYNALAKLNFKLDKLDTDVETDCSALVRVCCAYAGITGLPSTMRTGSMPSAMVSTGKFEVLKDKKYCESSDYLRRGDILVTRSSGHTVVVLTNGAKYLDDVCPYAEPTASVRPGDTGDTVRWLQWQLLQRGYDIGASRIDGVYGRDTRDAMDKFKMSLGCDPDGIAGVKVMSALKENA